jgi:hypothetical protein
MAHRNGFSAGPCCVLAYRRVPRIYPEPRRAILSLSFNAAAGQPFLLPALSQVKGAAKGLPFRACGLSPMSRREPGRF